MVFQIRDFKAIFASLVSDAKSINSEAIVESDIHSVS